MVLGAAQPTPRVNQGLHAVRRPWGQPVLDIIINAPAGEDLTFLRSTVGIEPGYLLEPEAVRMALKRLFAVGRFSGVEARFENHGNTIDLHFVLRALRRVEELQIVGLRSIDESVLRRHLSLGEGDEITRRTLPLLEQQTREFLRTSGFPHHRVSVRAMDTPSGTNVLLTAEEGTPVRVGTLRFTGGTKVTAKALKQLCRLRPGSVFDRGVLVEDLKRIEAEYRKRGFWQVKISQPKVERVKELYHISIPIEAGKRFALHIKGNRLFTDETLMTLWPEKKKIWRSSTLERFQDEIKHRYLLEGYNDVNILATHGTVKTSIGTQIEYILIIKEGTPTTVHHVSFPGAETIDEDRLRQQLFAALDNQLNRPDFAAHLHDAELRESSEGLPAWRDTGGPVFVSAIHRWVPEIYTSVISDIKAIYGDRGYLSIEIVPPKVTQVVHSTVKEVDVEIEVREGMQTIVGSLRFVGNSVLPATDLIKIFESIVPANTTTPMALGGPLTRSGIEETRIAISRLYGDRGYIYAKVFGVATVAKNGRMADVVFTIEEGPQVTIDNILVHGNRHTKEAVIRDRLEIRPHTFYQRSKVIAAQRELQSLGVFSDVRITLIDPETPASLKDLVAEVHESKRGNANFSIGLSTADGLRGAADYTRTNLFGHAWTAHSSLIVNRQLFFFLYGQDGDAITQRYINYSNNIDPAAQQCKNLCAPNDTACSKKCENSLYFLKQIEYDMALGVQTRRFRIPYDTVLNFQVNARHKNEIQYSLDEGTLGVAMNVLPSDRIRLSLEPRLAIRNLDCPTLSSTATIGTEGNSCSSALVRDRRRVIDEGKQTSVELLGEVNLDATDNRFNPTSGFRARLSGQLVSGTSEPPNSRSRKYEFLKAELVVGAYVSMGPVLWEIRASGGSIFSADPVPVNHRFFVGGPASHRAFLPGVMIPEDACAQPGITGPCTPLEIENGLVQTGGGHHYVLLRNDLNIPLAGPLLLNLFVDVGSLWFSAPRLQNWRPRVGLGFGLHLATPIGPLAFDFGSKALPRKGIGENGDFVVNFSITSGAL